MAICFQLQKMVIYMYTSLCHILSFCIEVFQYDNGIICTRNDREYVVCALQTSACGYSGTIFIMGDLNLILTLCERHFSIVRLQYCVLLTSVMCDAMLAGCCLL